MPLLYMTFCATGKRNDVSDIRDSDPKTNAEIPLFKRNPHEMGIDVLNAAIEEISELVS